MAKGKITIDSERCKGCGLCLEFCPNGVLSLDAQELNPKGYHPVSAVSAQACTGCGICALMCPDVAIVVERGNS